MRKQYVGKKDGEEQQLLMSSAKPLDQVKIDEWDTAREQGSSHTLQAPNVSGKSFQNSGPFNIDEERRKYGEWAEALDEPYKSALRYYNQNTEYIAAEKLKRAPFGYDPDSDVIFYNPNHPDFGDVDFQTLNTHELAHRLNALSETHSWGHERFCAGLTQAREYVNIHINEITQFLQERVPDDYFSDLLSACGVPGEYLPAGHDDGYWTEITRAANSFANLFAMGANTSEYLETVGEWFPSLLRSFMNRVGVM